MKIKLDSNEAGCLFRLLKDIMSNTLDDERYKLLSQISYKIINSKQSDTERLNIFGKRDFNLNKIVEELSTTTTYTKSEIVGFIISIGLNVSEIKKIVDACSFLGIVDLHSAATLIRYIK